MGLSSIVNGELFSFIGEMFREPIVFLQTLVLAPIFILGFFFMVAFFILTFFFLRKLFSIIYEADTPLFPEEENKKEN